MTGKTIGARSTSIYKSTDGQCGLMASTVEVEIDGHKVPNQIAIWLEEGENSIRAEFDKETIRQFIDYAQAWSPHPRLAKDGNI